jgi:ribonuclease T2
MMMASLLAMLAIVASGTQSLAQRSSGGYSQQQHIAGKFDYYQLVLSWSPTHCADNSRGDDDTQCGRTRARPYSFVMHGLWPQYERGWPQFCFTKGRPYVPNSVIDSMMDIMPSRGLIIHQYKKHGTCSGLDVPTYFKASRIAYSNVKIPKMFDAPAKPILITPAEMVTQFRSINPTLTNDAIEIVCKRGNANQLKEVKFCMSRKGAFRACTPGRATRHKCADKKIYVPPVRG